MAQAARDSLLVRVVGWFVSSPVRSIVPIVWVPMCALLLAGCEPDTAAQARPANVLLVSIDTLRADHVGAFGATEAKTPTLDRLAFEGVRFTNAISPAPLTLPSHATLLTALDPPRHGVRHNGVHRLSNEVTTLAERFREAGYATGAVVGSAVLAARHGLGQGFDHYDDAIVPADGRLGGAGVQRDARAVSQAARAWLSKAPEPFFLFIHYYDPHASYQPPPGFDRFAHPYDGEIAYVDRELAGVVETIGARHGLDETLIAVTADHGESLGEHHEATHAYTVYDATQRIPLLLRGRGIPPGRSVDAVVRLADVAPTLLARVGLDPLEGVDGEDLTALLDGKVDASRQAYVESLATQIDHGWAPLHGLRTQESLLIRAPRNELYDLRADPAQTRNVYDDPVRAGEREALEAVLMAKLADSARSQTLVLDPGTRAQLQALGYALPDSAQQSLDPTGPAIDPKDGILLQAAYHQAELAFAAGRLDEARAALERLVSAQPRSAPALAKLAMVNLRQGAVARARSHALRAAELQPASAPYWQQLGHVYHETGAYEEAREAFEHALRSDPDNVLAHLQQMESCAALGDLVCVRRADSNLLRLAGANVVALRRSADAWEAAGQRREALAAYERVLARAPDSPRDHMHAAIHAAALGDRETSDVHLVRAADVSKDPRAQRMLADAYAVGAPRSGPPRTGAQPSP
jgi:arylsulfatase A-like enzyme